MMERKQPPKAAEHAPVSSASSARGIMYGMLLAFAFITLLTACGLSDDDKQKGSEHMHGSETWQTTASKDVLPDFLSNHTEHTSDLYRAVHEHADIMEQMNCYCGCMDGLAVETPHDSLLRCYLAEHPAGEDGVTWTDHSTSCGICKKEMEMVIDMTKQGKTPDQIHEAIDAAFKPNKTS